MNIRDLVQASLHLTTHNSLIKKVFNINIWI